MERNGHMGLAPEIRAKLLAMSASTVDRALVKIRQEGGRQRRRPVASALRRSNPVRTSADWKDPAPDFVEADLVAHSGPSARGSFIQTLVLTDIAAGWTELSASCLPRGNGRLCTIAAAFTDIDPVDELRRIAQGKAAFPRWTCCPCALRWIASRGSFEPPPTCKGNSVQSQTESCAARQSFALPFAMA